ncbi:MAG: AI-2E family transporter [Alphaproteobacteria bacterium]
MAIRTRAAIWLGIAAFILVFLAFLSDILLPFVAGMAVAYFLDPVADRLEKWGCSRTLATTLITLGFILISAGIIVFVVPLLYGQIIDFLRRLPEYVATIRTDVLPAVQQWLAGLDPSQVDRAETLIAGFSERAVNFMINVLGGIWRSGLGLVNLLALVFITPVVTFYLLRDWDRIVTKVDSWLPRDHAPVIREQLLQIHFTLAAFVRGQGIICLILSIFYGITLTVIGLDFGLVIGIAAGLVSWIPYVGSIGGLAVSVGLAALQYPDAFHIGLVAGVFILGQLVADYFLTPKLLGKRVRLHPVWIIFAMLAGGSLFGFVGLMLSVPLAAVIGVLARFSISRYMESPLYHGGSDGPGDA